MVGVMYMCWLKILLQVQVEHHFIHDMLLSLNQSTLLDNNIPVMQHLATMHCTNIYIYVFNKQVCTCTSTHVFTHTLTVAGTQQPFQGYLIPIHLAHARRVSVYSMR